VGLFTFCLNAHEEVCNFFDEAKLEVWWVFAKIGATTFLLPVGYNSAT